MAEKKRVHTILTFIITLAAIYTGLALLMFLFQERLLFLPSSAITATPADFGMEYEEVFYERKNGNTLHAWFMPYDSDEPVNDRVTILFSHGNAGNISGRIHLAQAWRSAGFNVFLYDYQGYGKSSGRPGEKEILEDGLASWDFLTDELGIGADKILPVGRSLGGSVATYTALNRNARAVVVESTFTSVPDIAARTYPVFPVRLLARIELPTIEYIRQFEGAVLVAHSPEDTLIPYHMGREIYESVNGPKQWLELSGDHNEGYISTGQEYTRAFSRFANEHFEAVKKR